MSSGGFEPAWYWCWKRGHEDKWPEPLYLASKDFVAVGKFLFPRSMFVVGARINPPKIYEKRVRKAYFKKFKHK